jgi:hypothetical protein
MKFCSDVEAIRRTEVFCIVETVKGNFMEREICMMVPYTYVFVQIGV